MQLLGLTCWISYQTQKTALASHLCVSAGTTRLAELNSTDLLHRTWVLNPISDQPRASSCCRWDTASSHHRTGALPRSFAPNLLSLSQLLQKRWLPWLASFPFSKPKRLSGHDLAVAQPLCSSCFKGNSACACWAGGVGIHLAPAPWACPDPQKGCFASARPSEIAVCCLCFHNLSF